MSREPARRSFWARYRRPIIISVVVYVLVVLVLIVLSKGPQSLPFIYQIF